MVVSRQAAGNRSGSSLSCLGLLLAVTDLMMPPAHFRRLSNEVPRGVNQAPKTLVDGRPLPGWSGFQ